MHNLDKEVPGQEKGLGCTGVMAVGDCDACMVHGKLRRLFWKNSISRHGFDPRGIAREEDAR